MKPCAFTLILIFITFSSCMDSNPLDDNRQETPQALEEHSSSGEYLSKSRGVDILESLYDDLAEKTPELKKLELEIDNLKKSKEDSTYSFDQYNGKNQAYFNAANSHLEKIKDSLLRDKMRTLVSHSLKNYDDAILKHTALLKSIEMKTITLNDLHTVVKITKTLTVIESYQNSNLPPIISLAGYLKQLDNTITDINSIKK